MVIDCLSVFLFSFDYLSVFVEGKFLFYLLPFPLFCYSIFCLFSVFSTGQSVSPEGGRRWTALSGLVPSFSKLARRPGAKDYTPAVPREECFMFGWEMFHRWGTNPN